MNTILTVSIGLLFTIGASGSGFKYLGLSESGAEWGSNIPGTYYVDYIFPTTASIDYYAESGMNVIRLPFLWERLQPTLNGPFDSAYFALINKTVQYVTVTKGMYILLDVHNYGRYNNVILGEGVDYSTFQYLWNQIATIYKSNPNVIFGLMNEPHDMPYANVYQAMQAGINGIRASGATQLITVPGNDWTGAHSWVSGGSAAVMAAITDPLNNFMFEMHQYFDNNYSGNGACNVDFDPSVVFADATNWLRAQGRTGWLGEFGIENNPGCVAVLANTMAYLQANSDVWKAGTWWAVGAWWSSYKFSLDAGQGDQQLAVLKNYMPSVTVATPVVSTPTPAPTPVPTPVPTTPVTQAAATTGRAKPSTTSVVAAPSTTTTSAAAVPTPAPVPTPVTPTPAASSSSTSSSCVSGNMKCLSSNTYSTCNWGVWAAAQSCGINTVCSPNGDYIYCVTPTSTPVISTPTPTPSPVPTPAPVATPTPAPVVTPTPAPAPVSTPASTSSSSTSSTSSCTLGQSRCAGASSYQSCSNGRNGNVWAPIQQCQTGLSCHASGNAVYCY
jgi:endoglucanase